MVAVMKKMLFAGLAVAAMAALSISCQKNELQASDNRHPVSFEASISATPGTKFSMTDKGSYVKASWAEGDEIAVLWYAGTDDVTSKTYEKFTVTKVSADGKSATFSKESSAFPNDKEVTAMFVYPYRDYDESIKGYVFSAADLSAASSQNPSANAVYYAKADVKGGSIPSVTFTQQNSFLFIKKGTVIPGVSEGAHYFDFMGLYYSGHAKKNTKTQDNLSVVSGYVFNTSKKSEEGFKFDSKGSILQDVWIPFFPNNKKTTLNIRVYNNMGEKKYDNDTSPWDHSPVVAGKVYDLSNKFK